MKIISAKAPKHLKQRACGSLSARFAARLVIIVFTLVCLNSFDRLAAQQPTLVPPSGQSRPQSTDQSKPSRLAQLPGFGDDSTGPAIPQAVSGALKQFLGGGESLPAPAPNAQTGPPARAGFTIPLANEHDRSAIKLSENDGLISLAVRDAPLRHVLAMIAESQQMNLVFASSTDVPVTATLEKVPLPQALDSLLSASGYMWAKNGNVVYVTSIASAEGLPPNVQDRRVAVIEMDFASAVDLDPAVKGLLSPVGKSWILESNKEDNRRTKEAIVVEDLAAYVDRIEEYIAEADQPPRQVMIEVHLLQVDLGKDTRHGVNLSSLARVANTNLVLQGTGMVNPLPSASPITVSQAATTTTPSFYLQASGGDFSSLIEALITTTDAKTLASPRILAINGQESRLQIGEQLGFRVTTTTQTSTLESVEFLDVGVVLTVTPRITRDGRVLLAVYPEVSSGQVNPDTGLPEEETTELQTDVLLNSGQGMVLGGLIQERDTTSLSRVPILGSLPYAGFLFQRRATGKSRTELIVAMVPHVLPYTAIQQHRNEADTARAFDPLLYGPLCKYPRPYEAKMADLMRDHPYRACEIDNECCPEPTSPSWHPEQQIMRLPPVDSVDECETCIEEELAPTAELPQLGRRPSARRIAMPPNKLLRR